jgi:glycerol-3-phosphate dehydrogenase
MKRFIENHTNEKFDVIVIGGGITGASVAYEAATRGLKVALLEKKDFSWATSAVTSKMIHGGLRYLVNGEVMLVRESHCESAEYWRISLLISFIPRR